LKKQTNAIVCGKCGKTGHKYFWGVSTMFRLLSKNMPNLCPTIQKASKETNPWTAEHTKIVQQVKIHVRSLLCLGIPHPHAFMIVEIDASNIGFGGILKQKVESNKEQLVRFHSGLWHGLQQKYSTIKKEILAIVLCILKFQDDLFLKKFLLRIDCKSAKEVYKKMFKIQFLSKFLLDGK